MVNTKLNSSISVLHFFHQQQRLAPQAFPPRRRHRRPEAGGRGAQRPTRHALQQRHGERPLAATATGVDGGVEADDVGMDPVEDQVLPKISGNWGRSGVWKSETIGKWWFNH